MRLYHDAGGALLALRGDAEPAPEGAAGSVPFDPETNAALLDSLSGRVPPWRWQDHTVSGGQVVRGGTPLTVQPDGPREADRKDFSDRFADTMGDLDTIITQAQAGMTNAQRDQAILRIARALRRTYRRVTRLTKG